MASTGTNATIVAAVIGVIGSVAVALITNWDKFARKPESPPTQTQPTTAIAPQPAPTPERKPVRVEPAPEINIAGRWTDPANYLNGSIIAQNGNSIRINGWGYLPTGLAYESSGNGSVTGQTVTSSYTARYANGRTSQGNCQGTITPDGLKITSTCTDNILGTFVSVGVRQ